MKSPTPNPLHPNHMTAAERLAEIGRILAIGYLRGRNRARDRNRRNSCKNGDVSLDLPGERSGHGDTKNRRRESP